MQFIATIIHSPELIILDEPFSGLDATTVQLFTTALVEASRSGTTILFSSHILEQAEKICHSLCLIHRGTTVLEGTCRYRRYSASLRFSKELEAIVF